MASKPIALKTDKDLTKKQKAFITLLVKNWGTISQTDAAVKAGYGSNERSAAVMASKMLDSKVNPHIVRALENLLKNLRNMRKTNLDDIKHLKD